MRISCGFFLLVSVLVVTAIATLPNHTAAEDVPIRLGSVMPMTGVMSSVGIQVNAGLQDCLQIANAEGGINGRRIEYSMEDGQYKVEVGKEAFEKIINRDNPIAFFGESTHFSKAVSNLVRDKYRILYGSASFSSDLAQAEKYPAIFVPGPTYSDQLGIILKYIAEQSPGAKIGILYSESDFGKDPIDFAKRLMLKMKLELVALACEKLEQPDLDEVVRSLRQSHPDYVIIHGFAGKITTDFVRKCRAADMKSQIIGTLWEVSETIFQELGPVADGILAVSPYSRWWMDDVPMIKKMRDFGAQRHPETKHRPVSYMVGFTSGLIFVEVMRRADKAGKLNYDGMIAALKSIQGFDTGGLTAPLTNHNNHFPQARIWRGKASSGHFEPESEWTSFRLKRNVEGYQ